jgi:hypothetical protein
MQQVSLVNAVFNKPGCARGGGRAADRLVGPRALPLARVALAPAARPRASGPGRGRKSVASFRSRSGTTGADSRSPRIGRASRASLSSYFAIRPASKSKVNSNRVTQAFNLCPSIGEPSHAHMIWSEFAQDCPNPRFGRCGHRELGSIRQRPRPERKRWWRTYYV